MKFHPIAEIFPLILEGTADWNDLVDSIKSNGQLEPCVRDGDILLDGRNRMRACEKLGREPQFIEWSTLGLDIAQSEWIAAKNLSRRHLTDDQKATIAYQIDGWQKKHKAQEAQQKTQFNGKPGPGRGHKTVCLKSDTPFSPNRTTAEIAKLAGVSRHKIELAKKMCEAVGRGDLAEQIEADVKAGKIKLAAAVKKIPTKPKKEKPLRARVESRLNKLIKSFEESERSKVKALLREILL